MERPYLNALVLIERFGRDLADEYRQSPLSNEAIDAATAAIEAMVHAAEMHRALLEAELQPRMQ